MHNTTATPMHVEQPPSKEWLVPMEVVVEASSASTQDMEVNDDLKKQARTKTITMCTMDIATKESLEQKRIQNKEEAMETTTVCVYLWKWKQQFTEKKITKAMKLTKTKTRRQTQKTPTKNKKTPQQGANKQTKNKKETQDEEPLTELEAYDRTNNLTTSSKEIELEEEEELDESTEGEGDNQEMSAANTDSTTKKNPGNSGNKQQEEPNQDK